MGSNLDPWIEIGRPGRVGATGDGANDRRRGVRGGGMAGLGRNGRPRLGFERSWYWKHKRDTAKPSRAPAQDLGERSGLAAVHGGAATALAPTS